MTVRLVPTLETGRKGLEQGSVTQSRGVFTSVMSHNKLQVSLGRWQVDVEEAQRKHHLLQSPNIPTRKPH